MRTKPIQKAVLAAAIAAIPAAGCGRPVAERSARADAATPASTSAPAVARVNAARPTRATVRRTTEQPGQIEAIESTPIYAKLGGYAGRVAADIGDAVTAGQVLAELSVPEFDADLREKRAAIRQAEAGREQARAAVEVARAGVDSAQARVEQVRSGVRRSEAEAARWRAEFARVDQLARERALSGTLLDETRSKLQAAEAGRDEVAAQVRSAEAALAEAKAMQDKARADLDAAASRIDVARFGAEQAEAMAGYARIVAPFDGIVTRRAVDTGHLTTPGARVQWLPSPYVGPNWIRHDGQAQVVEGPVRAISKSSLFLGASSAAGSSVSGPVPAGGPAQVSGLTSILRISDAIFEPLAASQAVAARRAGVQVATNDALLGVAESYLDLQRAAGRRAIAREAAANAEALAGLTASYTRTGAGLDADYRRSLAERDRQRKNVELAVGDLEVASTDLVRRTRLDPRVVVAPVEPPDILLRLVPDGCPLDDLIGAGLHGRPELAEFQVLVQASLVRRKQARLRPLIPSVAFRYSGGGFGGGRDGFFGNFDGRSDADVNLYWEVQNLGLADRAIARQRAAQRRTADLELLKVQDRIAAEVVRAEKERIAAGRQVEEAGRALPEARASIDLNLANIRRGAGLPGTTRPVEVLQPVQALALARTDYLDAVLADNRTQFRLRRALGRPVQAADAPAGPR